MRVLVKSYHDILCTYHECLVLPPHPDAGSVQKIDLLVANPIVANPFDLVGKEVDILYTFPYISIGMECKIVPKEGEQMSHDNSEPQPT